MKLSRILACGAALAAAGAIAIPALAASHGKVGLWEITTTMNMAGMQMPDLSKLPPDQRAMVEAQMKKNGVTMSGRTMTTKHCMTAQEVAAGKPDMSHMKDCTVQNLSTTASGMSADLVCKGDMNGRGHMQVSYSGDTSYSGSMTMKGSAHGQPIDMTNTFSGKWVSADCGSVNH